MTPRFNQALALAAEVHLGVSRKETTIPYITHPVAVAALVARHGGDEDQQIAALLHDVLEDGGERFLTAVSAFGDRVLAIVRGCTDGMPGPDGRKAPWLQRKTAYLQHLAGAPMDTLLVSGCDKLHNAQAILEDLQEVGLAVFDRFSSTRTETLWYYQSLARTFRERGVPVAWALERVVGELQRSCAGADDESQPPSALG